MGSCSSLTELRLHFHSLHLGIGRQVKDALRALQELVAYGMPCPCLFDLRPRFDWALLPTDVDAPAPRPNDHLLCAAGLEPRLVQSYAWNSVWERLASQDKYRLRHIQNDRD
jgi:hypothetical protein